MSSSKTCCWWKGNKSLNIVFFWTCGAFVGPVALQCMFFSDAHQKLSGSVLDLLRYLKAIILTSKHWCSWCTYGSWNLHLPSSAFICVERSTTTFRKATKESFLDANGSLGWERRGCPIGNSKFHSSRTHPMPNHFFSGCLMKGGLYLDHHSGWYFGLNRESGLFHNRQINRLQASNPIQARIPVAYLQARIQFMIINW